MQPLISPIFFSILLFLGMLAMLEVGRRFSPWHPSAADVDKSSLGTIETAVFALFGLLMAFTFSGAALRFQEKRALVAEEASAIESVYMRVDLVAPEAQAGLRDRLRQYVDARLEFYRLLPNMKAADPVERRAKALQGEIWTAAVNASRLPNEQSSGSRLLLAAIGNMIRIDRTRMVSLQNHPPPIIYGLLFFLGILCSMMAGVRMAARPRRSWLHMMSLPLVVAAVVYVTIDIEYPRVGLIRLEQADQLLKDVRENMK